VSTPKKPHPQAIEDPRPLTPVRTDGPTNTVITAEEVDPREAKTAALPAWSEADEAPVVPITQPTPAWPAASSTSSGETSSPAVPITRPTPAWPAAGPASTDETPAPEVHVEAVTTRPVERPAPRPDVTAAELAVVDSSAHLRGVTTTPSKVPRPRLSRSTRLILVGSTAVMALALAVVAARRERPADPSRPIPLAKVPQTKPLPKEPPPKPAPRVDVTPELVAKEAPRPPLTMELSLDAGAGQPPLTKTVPASIVRIETEPMVKVTWNGEDYGLTPVLLTMPVGPNLITVENKDLGFKKTMTITAASEERTFLRFEFARGWVSIDRPETATVLVDGVKVKDRTVALWEGRHRIDVVFRGGQKASKTADVVRGETSEVFFDEPLPNE
jgi:hypothetical protein